MPSIHLTPTESGESYGLKLVDAGILTDPAVVCPVRQYNRRRLSRRRTERTPTRGNGRRENAAPGAWWDGPGGDRGNSVIPFPWN